MLTSTPRFADKAASGIHTFDSRISAKGERGEARAHNNI